MLCFALELHQWKQINLGLVLSSSFFNWYLRWVTFTAFHALSLSWNTEIHRVRRECAAPRTKSQYDIQSERASLQPWRVHYCKNDFFYLPASQFELRRAEKNKLPFPCSFFRGIILCRTSELNWIKLSLRNIWDLSKSWKSNIFLPIFIKDSKKEFIQICGKQMR